MMRKVAVDFAITRTLMASCGFAYTAVALHKKKKQILTFGIFIEIFGIFLDKPLIKRRPHSTILNLLVSLFQSFEFFKSYFTGDG